jgi:gluconolactonase
MTRHLVASIGVIAFLAAALNLHAEDRRFPTMGKIERFDGRFDKLIAPDAVMEKITDGHDWTEGPVWVPGKPGFLLFSDIPRNSIYKWQDGEESLFLKLAGYTGDRTDLKEPGTNGLILGRDGKLYLCEHGDRRVTRLDLETKEKTELAHRYMDKRLNSPNDGVFHSSGDLYFTDPPYGRMVKDKPGFPDRDLEFCGVYRLSRDGKLTLLTQEMTKPNGITLSPDEKTLYVANSDPALPIWKKFPVKEDGTLGEGTVFHDASKRVGKYIGNPDGMKVDRDGNVWATGPGGVLVFDPDGTLLGVLNTGVKTSNCNWGDDGTVLYITADKAVCRIKTRTKGKGF